VWERVSSLISHLSHFKVGRALGRQLRGRALDSLAQGSGFNPSPHKRKQTKKDGRLRSPEVTS
jgi:hypothetical protein